jgi:hypothetical protein
MKLFSKINIKKVGIIGFLFFLVKGIAWIFVGLWTFYLAK